MFRNIILTSASLALLCTPYSIAPASAGIFDRKPAVATERDKKTLRRLLRPHFSSDFLIITSGVRAATGNPNIAVFDRRGGSDDVVQCSYITVRGEKALICD